MAQKIDWEMLARYIAGESASEERRKTAAWIDAHPDNRALVESLEKVCRTSLRPLPKSDSGQALRAVAEKAGIAGLTGAAEIPDADTGGRAVHFRRRFAAGMILRYAAVFLLIVLSPLIYTVVKDTLTGGEALNFIEVNVKNGMTRSVTLADGTKVMLDSGSHFSYPAEFSVDVREVYLAGEAFFDVERDAERPFTVHAGKAVIKVLGTKFNVRAWDEAGAVTVAVEEGSVSLRLKDRPERHSVVINSGNMSILSADGRPTAPRPTGAAEAASWRNREIDFEDAALVEILNQLERWYDLDIVITDRSLLSLRLTINISNRSIDSVLDLLATLLNVKYEKYGKKVIIGIR